jgi:hypothetical protein
MLKIKPNVYIIVNSSKGLTLGDEAVATRPGNLPIRGRVEAASPRSVVMCLRAGRKRRLSRVLWRVGPVVATQVVRDIRLLACCGSCCWLPRHACSGYVGIFRSGNQDALLWLDPLQLGLGGCMFYKVLGTRIHRDFEFGDRRSRLAFQQVPLANIEMRLAAVLRRSGRCQRLRS